jgi:hypothetical protein
MGIYQCRLRFAEYKRPNPLADEEFNTQLEVNLPLPTQLSDYTTVGYDQVQLGLINDITNVSDQAVRNIIGSNSLKEAGLALGSAVSGSARSIVNRGILETTPKVIGAIPGVSTLANGNQISALIQQFVGAAVNPNASQTLRGPVLRNFSYNWTLLPHNAEESLNILKTIQAIKARALPNVLGTKASGVLGYPNVVLMNFYPWDDGATGGRDFGMYEWSYDSIVKIKRCVITNVTANWNATNSPAYFRGTHLPVSVQLSIQLSEVEYFLAEDETNSVGIRLYNEGLHEDGRTLEDDPLVNYGKDAVQLGAESLFEGGTDGSNIPDSSQLFETRNLLGSSEEGSTR